MSFSLPREQRLRRAEDFRRVFEARRSVSDAWLIVYGRKNDLPYSRLGLSVSRKYGNAVRRNRLRRLYREAFRLTKNELPTGLDLILIPRSNEEPGLEALKGSLLRLLPALVRRLEREAKR